MVGAGAARHHRAGHVAHGVERQADELLRRDPIEPHAALRRVHRLRHAEAERPEVFSIRDGAVPIELHVEPRVLLGERVGHDVGGGERDAREGRRGLGEVARRGGGVLAQAAAGDGKADGRHRQSSSLGRSTQRRSFQDCSPAIASCTPLAPASRFHGYSATSPATWRRNSSHCTRKPFG